MRLLRLGTSNDGIAEIPEEQRAYRIAEHAFTNATGLTLEITRKRFWPAAGFEDGLRRWLDDVDPEMVYLVVPSYPVCYESVPLRLERRLGRFGRWINTGSQATASGWFGRTRAFHAARRSATRAIGGDTFVTVPEMMQYISKAATIILAREDVVLAIRGPRMPYGVETEASLARSEIRRRHLNRELANLCTERHIPFTSYEEPPHPSEDTLFVLADRVHMNVAVHAETGAFEGEGMISAWRAAHPGSMGKE